MLHSRDRRIRLSRPAHAILYVLLAALPASVSAEEGGFDIAHTEACLAGATEPEARRWCIGVSADRCLQTPMGGSTVGMGACLSFEWEYWDARLNENYRVLRAEEAQADIDMAGDRGAVPRAEALRDMQRAWIAFRDATCTYERSQWGSGTGGGPIEAGCHLRLTGEQALYLESQLGME